MKSLYKDLLEREVRRLRRKLRLVRLELIEAKKTPLDKAMEKSMEKSMKEMEKMIYSANPIVGLMDIVKDAENPK